MLDEVIAAHLFWLGFGMEKKTMPGYRSGVLLNVSTISLNSMTPYLTLVKQAKDASCIAA
jgi:hypothetical protein